MKAEALRWTDPLPEEDIELVLQLKETMDRVCNGKLAVLYFLHGEYEVNVNIYRACSDICFPSHERGSMGVSVSHTRITGGQKIFEISPSTSRSFGDFLSPGPGAIANFDKWRSRFRDFTCQNCRLSASYLLYCFATLVLG
jgi:hypothetical protein